MGQSGDGDLCWGDASRLPRTRHRARGRARPRMHRITACRLPRRPELRFVGRRCVSDLASASRRDGTRHHRPSAAGQLRPPRLAPRRAGQPPRLDERSIARRAARTTSTLFVDRLQARSRGTRDVGSRRSRARAFIAGRVDGAVRGCRSSFRARRFRKAGRAVFLPDHWPPLFISCDKHPVWRFPM